MLRVWLSALALFALTTPVSAALGPEVNNGTTIDNDYARSDEGYISARIDSGGRSNTFRMTAKGRSGNLRQNIEILYDTGFYVDLGRNGNAFLIPSGTLTQSARLIGHDRVESRGYFNGNNGRVNWISTSWINNAESSLYLKLQLSSANPLGSLRVIHYLDEDIIGANDDILAVSGTPGQSNYRVMTIDNNERLGFAHSNDASQASNAQYLGWAAKRYSKLRQTITGNGGASYALSGVVDTGTLPPFNDPDLGTVYGPKDVTSALAWDANSGATQMTITAVLGAVGIGDLEAPPLQGLQGFQIQHDGQGVYYCPETVTVTAKDQDGNTFADYSDTIELDTGTHSGRWQLLSGNGSLTNPGNDGRANYQFAAADQGTAQFELTYNKFDDSSLNLNVSDTADPSKTDDNSEGNLTLSHFGLRLSNLSNTPISTQRAGVSFPIRLTAVSSNTALASCQVMTQYQGNKTLSWRQQWHDPINGTQGVQINGTSLPSNGQAQNQSVAFNQGVAQVNAQYPDVGLITLMVNDSGNTQISGSSGYFVVTPFSLALQSSASQWVAGRPFTLALSGRQQNGGVTPNFGRESDGLAVQAAHTVTSPNLANAGNWQGTLSSNSAPGQLTGQFTFSEVGNVQVTANLSQYLGANVNLNAQTALPRFVPDHFDVDVIQHGQLAANCTGLFSYLGQDMGFNQPAIIQVSAKNAADTLTSNYRDAHNRLQPSSLVLQPAGQDAAALNRLEQPLGVVSSGFGNPTLQPQSAGIYRFQVQGNYRYQRNSLQIEVTPFAANLPIEITALSDTDGVAMAAGSDRWIRPHGVPIRFGRVKAFPARGTPADTLNVETQMEYFTNAELYAQNTDDSCTQISLINIVDLDASDDFNFTTGGAWGQAISPAVGAPTMPSGGAQGKVIYALPPLTGDASTGIGQLSYSVPNYLRYPWNDTGFINPSTQFLYRMIQADHYQNVIHIQELF